MVQANNAIAAPTSRRNFITSSAALVIASASPALAFPILGQDAELIELSKQILLNQAQWTENGVAYDRAHDAARKQYPALPDVLKARKSDAEFGLPKPNDAKWSNRPMSHAGEKEGYYSTFHLTELKQLKPRRSVRVPSDQYIAEYSKETGQEWPALYFKSDDTMIVSVPWPEAQARIDELIAAIEIWWKARRRIDCEAGLMKVERDNTRYGNREDYLLKKMVKIKATSLQGLLAKATAVKVLHSEEDEIEFGESTDEVLAASVLNELLALKAA